MKLVWNEDWLREVPGAQEVVQLYSQIDLKEVTSVVLPRAGYKGKPLVTVEFDGENE